MRTLLISGILLSLSSPVLADGTENPALQALQSSQYGWMTDSLDMQGDGFNGGQDKADEMTKQIENLWKIQKEALRDFKTELKDPLFRSAVDEMLRLKTTDYVSLETILSSLTNNPVVKSAFSHYGPLTEEEEIALGSELAKFGYIQRVYNGSTDTRAAVLKLWREAPSPEEERFRYWSYRGYGID
jgi:hypothetical protein